MTTTQVVEEALRAYLPPAVGGDLSARLVRKGAILVKSADGRQVSLADANAALDETRAERG